MKSGPYLRTEFVGMTHSPTLARMSTSLGYLPAERGIPERPSNTAPPVCLAIWFLPRVPAAPPVVTPLIPPFGTLPLTIHCANSRGLIPNEPPINFAAMEAPMLSQLILFFKSCPATRRLSVNLLPTYFDQLLPLAFRSTPYLS